MAVDGSKLCVYTKRMCWQNFRIFEKKLDEGSVYLFYNWIYNDINLQKKLKSSFWTIKLVYMSSYVTHIWVKMPRKNNGLFDVLLSQSLWLKCALLCLTGCLELDCSWTALQCESPQVIRLAKSKYLHIFEIFFWQTLNCH